MTTTNTLQRVERACADLHHAGDTVTFTAVAARADLSRTTLYRNPALRAVVDQHRHRSTSSGSLIGLTDEIAMLRTALEALATRVHLPLIERSTNAHMPMTDVCIGDLTATVIGLCRRWRWI